MPASTKLTLWDSEYHEVLRGDQLPFCLLIDDTYALIIDSPELNNSACSRVIFCGDQAGKLAVAWDAWLTREGAMPLLVKDGMKTLYQFAEAWDAL